MPRSMRRRHVPAGAFAAGVALALLPTAADAVTFYNSSGATVRFALYDQNDGSVAVSCFDTELPPNTQATFTNYPGTCGLYAIVKVKAVAKRSTFVDGATCWGEHLGKTGEARVSGGVDGCSVTITSN